MHLRVLDATGRNVHKGSVSLETELGIAQPDLDELIVDAISEFDFLDLEDAIAKYTERKVKRGQPVKVVFNNLSQEDYFGKRDHLINLIKTAGDVSKIRDKHDKSAEVLTVPMNIREPDQVTALMEAVWDRFGGVDVLVNNAGGQFAQDAIDFSPKGWKAVIDNNLNGTWYMMQTAARRWRDQGRPGAIVNVTASVTKGIYGVAHSCAARAAVNYLSKTVAVEWAPLDIRVNCIALGTHETEGFANYDPEASAQFHRSNPMIHNGDA